MQQDQDHLHVEVQQRGELPRVPVHSEAGSSLLRERIVAEARTWLGTPYHHHGRIKGVGTDCAMLLAEVFEATGAMPHIDPGFYPPHWHLHRTEERYLGYLEQYGVEIPGPPLPGDVVAFKTGRAFGHAAIVVAWPDGIHACIDDGVTLADLTQGWLAGRLTKFYSIVQCSTTPAR